MENATMRKLLIARYALDDTAHYGIVEGSILRRLASQPFDGINESGHRDAMARVRLLAPVPQPRIFGLGYNYKAHSQESHKAVPDSPVVFMKPSTSAIGPDDSIVYPSDAQIVHYEGELTVVIGKRCRHVPEASALDCVFGYTCGNDVSDRVVQRRESAFGCLLAGKGYDTFAPIGPFIATGLDPSDQRVITRVNGVVRQDGNSRDLVFPVPYLVAYLSRFMTLLPGDLIMTGTPAGVGPLSVGDTVEVEIPGIGILRNPVAAEGSASSLR
jgi:2-keto-4-pentenoate hydratase/2-oxohepta-3-ene-1,7-dioic acid hydratase in catechol pathway